MNPTKEELVLNKVDHHFDGKDVFWSIESLMTHYPHMIIHESDVIEKVIDEKIVRCIMEKDVDFNLIMEPVVENTVEAVTPVGPTPENLGMTFEDADELRKFGNCIALPEWSGFWFDNLKTGELMVLTKEGKIVNTPHEEYKERIDWMLVEPTAEQLVLLESYYAGLESAAGELPKEKEETVTEEITEILTPVVEQETVIDVTKEVVLEPANKIEEVAAEPVKEATVKAPKKKAAAKE